MIKYILIGLVLCGCSEVKYNTVTYKKYVCKCENKTILIEENNSYKCICED